jgi:hypothetical protein
MSFLKKAWGSITGASAKRSADTAAADARRSAEEANTRQQEQLTAARAQFGQGTSALAKSQASRLARARDQQVATTQRQGLQGATAQFGAAATNNRIQQAESGMLGAATSQQADAQATAEYGAGLGQAQRAAEQAGFDIDQQRAAQLADREAAILGAPRTSTAELRADQAALRQAGDSGNIFARKLGGQLAAFGSAGGEYLAGGGTFGRASSTPAASPAFGAPRWSSQSVMAA